MSVSPSQVRRSPGPHDEVSRAALSGDVAALDQLVGLWLPQVYAWCARLGGPRVDPEEAAHDVLMHLVRRHTSIEAPAVLPRWLFSTCRRVVANHRRRVWLKRWIPGIPADMPTGRRPDHAFDQAETVLQVYRVLQDLSKAHREVLTLCYLEDRSVREASEILNIPEGTVKSRLYHARVRFQQSFGEAP